MLVARDLMTKEVISTRASCKVEQVTRVLYHHGISGLPVLDEQHHVIGMVTEADILDRKRCQRIVQDIMSVPVYAVFETRRWRRSQPCSPRGRSSASPW